MKKIIFLHGLIQICLIVSCATIFAATYYLSPTGSDTNGNGSEAKPWFSPAKAKKSKGTIQPGDTVIFKNGTYSYNGYTCLLGYNEDDAGTEASPITYKAETRGQVILDFGCDYGWRLDDNTSANIILDGFTIVRTKHGIRLKDENQTVRYINVTATQTWPPDDTICSGATGGGGFTTYTGAENFLIEYCIADKIAYDYSSHGVYIHAGSGTVRDSIFRNNLGNGIQIQNNGTFPKMGTIYVYRNKVYNNSDRHGIYSDAYNPGGEIGNVYVYNNLVWNNGYNYSDGWGITLKSDNIQRDFVMMVNNTVYNNRNGIRASGCINGGVVANNIVYNSISSDIGTIGANITFSNNLTTDPSFLSTNEDDDNFLKLSSSSNAIDQGKDLSSEGITDDYFGNSRPRYSQADPSVDSDYDIGAHEYTVEAPSNLRIAQ
jgi:hypothetical protein